MNLPELKLLLERYYNGETSSDEEEKIRKMLSDKNLPGEYFPEREMFEQFSAGMTIPEPSIGFKERIMKAIDNHEKESAIKGLRRRIYTVTSVAASLLILISSYLIISREKMPDDTFTDPLVAYNETKRVLLEVSTNLNRGYQELDDLAYINRATESLGAIGKSASTVENELSQLGYMQKGLDLYDLVSKVKSSE